MNAQNFGIAVGRLTRDPQVFANSDGSQKVMITIAVQRNFKNKDGKKDSDFINMEGLVSKDRVKVENGVTKLGVYDYMKKGSLVDIQYTIRTNPYKDKNGEMQYPQVSFIENISLLESKNVTDARQNNNATKEAPAPAEEAPAAEDAPFADK